MNGQIVLLQPLRAPCKAYEPGVWEGIEREDSQAVVEVPYWIWAPLLGQIQPLLEERYQQESDDDKLKKALFFTWGYLRDHLRWCRCVISGTTIEIVPPVPLVQLARAFAGAKHRLFMSATLSDDSALVRELGCSPEAAKTPIVPPSDAGVGERMVLAPSLVDPALDRDWVLKWCASCSTWCRVVVLTASEKTAKQWQAVGATLAMGTDVTKAVDGLKAGSLTFVAFPQRYDGVDLPDDACRILVLDGMPVGQGLAEDYDRPIPGKTGGPYKRWINRIEQGMGRAVRSQADYAVVVVTGPDLVNFLAKRDVIEQLGSATRAQLKASEKLTQMAKGDGRPAYQVVGETAVQCIKRDPGWRAFYEKNVRKKVVAAADPPDEKQIAIADAEQRAQRAAMSKDPNKAAEIIGDAINAASPSAEQCGWLLQRKAFYTFALSEADALKIQAAAFERNDRLLVPPIGVSSRRVRPALASSKAVLTWYNTFDHPNGAVAAIAAVRAKLSFDVSAHEFEQALMDVATIFGADGSRPEKTFKRGPDDLWEWTDSSWVIEAKNERKGKLPKADSGQMHDSMQWFASNYPERHAVPVVAAREPFAEFDAHFPEGTRVLTPAGVDAMLQNLEKFGAALTKKEPLIWKADEVNALLLMHKLDASQFKAAYTAPLTQASK